MKKEKVTPEFKEKRKNIQKELWKNQEYAKHMSEVHKGQKAWNKGVPFNQTLSIEKNNLRKQKISKTLKEKYKTGERQSASLGKKMDLKSIKKLSQSLIKLYQEGKMPSGERHHSWKGGVNSQRKKEYHLLKYKLWRLSIFERDNYTCQKCNKHGGMLQADHIKRWADYPELRYEISNGQTLCKKCHQQKTGEENVSSNVPRGKL